MAVAVGVLKNIPLCIKSLDSPKLSFGKDNIILDKLRNTLTSLQQIRHSSIINHSETMVSFDDPINRLIFESAEGEISNFHTKLQEYFVEHVTINPENMNDWINENL